MPLAAIDIVRATLLQNQFSCGGWSSLLSGKQVSLEATALAALATKIGMRDAYPDAIDCLLRAQHRNGSWPAFVGDDRQGSWVTALVLLALGPSGETVRSHLSGIAWLLATAGREANWFWKWKFRTSDAHVRFNPDKYGWPWHPDTNSWVVPTAFSLLALGQLQCGSGFKNIRERVRRGREMLLDRACPSGGWNAGNGMAYGVPLTPHPDDTAIALLALTAHGRAPAVAQSVSWLTDFAVSLSTPWSLGWAILALSAYKRNVDRLVERLASILTTSQIEYTATLAVGLLALEHQRALFNFGVL